MSISQVTNQQNFTNLQNVGGSEGRQDSLSQDTTLTQKVKMENEKAAQKVQQEGTHVEKMQEQVQKSQLKELVDNMNKNLDPFNTSLKFGFEDKSDTYYVSVIDTNTNDVIRKFPSEDAMKLSVKMKELVGMIFDQKG